MNDLVPILLAAGVSATCAILGYAAGRYSSARIIRLAGEEALRQLRAAQVAEDDVAMASMPPLVTVDEAIALANRLGISVEEAAERIFLAHARIAVARNLRRHGYRR